MMILLRILVTGAWFGCFILAAHCAGTVGGDLQAIGYMVIGIFLGVAMSAVWTPVIAEFLCGSMNVLDDCTYVEPKSRLNQWIIWATKRRHYSLLVFLCLLKGFLRPELPSAFIQGLKHSKPGSWVEKLFARRLFRFNNTRNCLRAAKILEEHGEKPRWHHNADVVLSMLAEEKLKADLKKTQRIEIPPRVQNLLSDTTTQLPMMG